MANSLNVNLSTFFPVKIGENSWFLSLIQLEFAEKVLWATVGTGQTYQVDRL